LNRYIARNYAKQGASGYQPRKQNYMQMSNNDAIDMLRKKIAQKLSSGPGELRRSFELFDRDGSGKVRGGDVDGMMMMMMMMIKKIMLMTMMMTTSLNICNHRACCHIYFSRLTLAPTG